MLSGVRGAALSVEDEEDDDDDVSGGYIGTTQQDDNLEDGGERRSKPKKRGLGGQLAESDLWPLLFFSLLFASPLPLPPFGMERRGMVTLGQASPLPARLQAESRPTLLPRREAGKLGGWESACVRLKELYSGSLMIEMGVYGGYGDDGGLGDMRVYSLLTGGGPAGHPASWSTPIILPISHSTDPSSLNPLDQTLDDK
ncbi:hypothetical protein SODALDRAFT_354069 [Sodiomyces alkalinus F11]|uniref:Uncharacterized protein n=1 Tax=Sodiomyces alkalinus (strain CBS 110278 / VKM F-3762 / F11) TaxID=1314773 RepID=A0A3N2Q5P3_SODAK|nr:hypothetical protein SODALDRAFT_354069 [Sodiomyces alkalinus F11]ROT41945.1 hypothetical protein SODALDRAFT_354069 [Sodiomyces alkalinus F11]